MPRSLTTQRGEDGRSLGRPQLEQFPDFGAYVPPLFPEAHAQAAAQPGIKLRERTVVLRQSKVLHPAPNILVELTDPVGHRDAPASSRQLTQPVAKVLERLGRPVDARSLEGEAQE